MKLDPKSRAAPDNSSRSSCMDEIDPTAKSPMASPAVPIASVRLLAKIDDNSRTSPLYQVQIINHGAGVADWVEPTLGDAFEHYR